MFSSDAAAAAAIHWTASDWSGTFGICMALTAVCRKWPPGNQILTFF